DLGRRGNTLVVVEHDPVVIGRADWVIDLGPRAGEAGGGGLYSRRPSGLSDTPTGRYLRGGRTGLRRRPPPPRPAWVRIGGARHHNLKNPSVRLPLGRLTCVTGVSGSGKSSLVEETLYRAAARRLGQVSVPDPGPYDAVEGLEALSRVALVDQSPIGKSPRSNPVTYIKAFDLIRQAY